MTLPYLRLHIITQTGNDASHAEGHTGESLILIHRDHIVSIRPIKMSWRGEVILGYWVRLTNGKKYKAVRVPSEIIDMMNADLGLGAPQFLDLDGQPGAGHEILIPRAVQQEDERKDQSFS
jgi:hypothetical protein